MAGLDPINENHSNNSFCSSQNAKTLLDSKPLPDVDVQVSMSAQPLYTSLASTHSFWDEAVALKIFTCIPIIGLLGSIFIAHEIVTSDLNPGGKSIRTLEKEADYMICLGIQAVSLIVIAAVAAPFASIGLFGLAFVGGFLLSVSAIAYGEIQSQIDELTAPRGPFGIRMTLAGLEQAFGRHN